MADIFLSYNEKDRERARRVATGLTEAGWSVWWDRRIPAGETWRSVLEDALENMRCMIVLWTANSIESEWVYEEASEGRRQDKLIPVMLDAVRPPAGFREIQAADLTGWDGSPEFEGWRLLLADLENMLGPPAGKRQAADDKKPDDHHERPPWPVRRLAVWALAGLLPVAGLVYFLPRPSPPEPAAPRETMARPEEAPLPSAPPPHPVSVVSPLSAPPAMAPEEKPAERPVTGEKPLQRYPAATVSAIKQPRPAIADATKRSSARCADLLSRIQLGESLSEEAQAILQKECK
nr:TIR domain-containing protein [Dechloromonas sp.]